MLEESIHVYSEKDKSLRSKNAYDVLLKGLNKRNGAHPKILEKQQIMATIFVNRICNVFKGYLHLLEEKRAEGADLEGECKFVLKRICQLESGADVFKKSRVLIEKYAGEVPKEESSVWQSEKAVIISVSPLTARLISLSSQ